MIASRAGRAPTIGRERERALAQQRIEALAEGQGSVLLISGEAGIGKSRLALELQAQAALAGLPARWARCFEQDRLLPYAPIQELLELPAGAEPDGARMLPSPLTGAAATEASQHMARAAAERVLARAAPVVILEDAHWCDDASLAVVHRLARHTAVGALLLAITYRPDETPDALEYLLADLKRERLSTEIILGPLSAADARTLAQALLAPDLMVDSERMAELVRLADGNPYFLEELVSTLAEHAGDAAGGAALPRLPVPRAIQASVQRRAARFSPAARELLAPAALTGRQFAFDLLQRVTGYDEPTLLAALRDLVEARLVVEDAPDEFIFRHELTRQAVLVGLLARERRTLHRRVAAALEAGAATSDAVIASLAVHYFEAGEWQRAHHYSQLAGERAAAMLAPHTAAEHFSRALDAAQRTGNTATADLHRARGRAYDACGLFDRALADFETVLELEEAAGDARAEWQALIDLGFLWAARDYSRMQPYFERALALAREHGDATLIARSLDRIGNWLVNGGRPDEAVPYHQEALRLYEGARDLRGMAEALDLLGLATSHCGALTDAVGYYERAVGLYREFDEHDGLVSGLTMLSAYAVDHPGSPVVVPGIAPDLTLARADEAVSVARAANRQSSYAYALINQAYCLTAQGRFAAALDAGLAGLAIAHEIEHRQWIVAGHATLAGVYLGLLVPELACATLDRAQTALAALDSPYWNALLGAVRAEALLMLGNHAAAAALIATLPEPSGNKFSRVELFRVRVEAELALGTREPEKVPTIFERFRAAIPRSMTADQIAPTLWLTRSQALIQLKRLEEAASGLELAREGASARQSLPLLWRCHLVAARLAQAEGRRADASRDFAAARATIESLALNAPDDSLPELDGATLRVHFLRAATALLPRARPATPLQEAKHAAGGLTARERQVAQLIAAGKTNREIAAALVIGERTVQTHVANIMAKLGHTSRARIAAWAVENHVATRLD